tara:strand:+ start:1260 stop:2747 length:1488 start_codon:yes stop_codon:yes gene_type:complete
MGLIKFQVPLLERIKPDVTERAYMADPEGIPWAGHLYWNGDCLVLSRESDESGNFYIPWEVPGRGELILSTGGLIERSAPYSLPIELARGTLHRLRSQLAAWQMMGLLVTDTVQQAVTEALHTFATAVTDQTKSPQTVEYADHALHAALRAMELLIDQYSHQIISSRRQQTKKLSTVFAVNLGHTVADDKRAAQLLTAFNSAAVPLTWGQVETSTDSMHWEIHDRQVDWCQRKGVRIIGGPLIRLDAAGLPDWIVLWEDDFEIIESYVLNYVDTAVQRYQNKIALWNCAARTNTQSSLKISEEQQLRLTVKIIERARQIEERTPMIVTFDQPWAEYVARTPMDLTPFQLADTLARSKLGISGFGIELNLGYWPGGSGSRDLLEISRLLDRWSLLGLPLVVFLVTPSDTSVDPEAAHQARPISSSPDNQVTPQSQQALIDQLVPLLLSKQSLHGVVWNRLADVPPHDFPHGGLFDRRGRAKPVLNSLTQIRRKHLV